MAPKTLSTDDVAYVITGERHTYGASNQMFNLFAEQEGFFESQDLGTVRACVSVYYTSDALNFKNRVRVVLFNPATFEWKEVISYGPFSMIFLKQTQSETAAALAKSANLTEGAAADPENKAWLTGLHMKLKISSDAGRLPPEAELDFSAAWAAVTRLFG